jgi:hypothetical protein
LVKGGFSKLSFPRPAAAVSGDSPTTYQPLQPPSTPVRDFAGPSRRCRGRDGSPAWAGLPRTRNPRECFSRGFL